MSSSNKPVHEVRLGRIKAAIWENETSNGVRHNVTLQRIYRDGEQWKTSDSFGREDLPLVIKVVVWSNFVRKGGHPLTGERKTKQTKSGERHYTYYRCTYYNVPGHPRVRVTEAELDRQVLSIFDRIRIEDEEIRKWFRAVLVAQTKDAQQESISMRSELQRQVTLTIGQQDRLLDMRLANEIEGDTFSKKQENLRDRLDNLKLQLDALDRSHDETAELAAKVFELS